VRSALATGSYSAGTTRRAPLAPAFNQCDWPKMSPHPWLSTAPPLIAERGTGARRYRQSATRTKNSLVSHIARLVCDVEASKEYARIALILHYLRDERIPNVLIAHVQPDRRSDRKVVKELDAPLVRC
jgi:hypothetical protein